MFTGIVEEIGDVKRVETRSDGSVRLTLCGPLVTADAAPGDSVAVSGVCLTLTAGADRAFTVDVMKESLDRSSLGVLAPGHRVNLERALAAGGRFGGHLVQGHVDGTAVLLSRHVAEHWQVLRLSLPGALARYVVEKGSITVDGVSLTVSAIGADWFEVSLVPTTLQRTTLGALAVGAAVNLEVDVLAKYVEKLLLAREA